MWVWVCESVRVSGANWGRGPTEKQRRAAQRVVGRGWAGWRHGLARVAATCRVSEQAYGCERGGQTRREEKRRVCRAADEEGVGVSSRAE